MPFPFGDLDSYRYGPAIMHIDRAAGSYLAGENHIEAEKKRGQCSLWNRGKEVHGDIKQ